MDTLEELFKEGSEFADIMIFTLCETSLKMLIDKYNGGHIIHSDYQLFYIHHKDRLLSFKMPIEVDYHHSAVRQFKGNPLTLIINNERSSIRIIDVASSFGKYYKDQNDMFKELEKQLYLLDETPEGD